MRVGEGAPGRQHNEECWLLSEGATVTRSSVCPRDGGGEPQLAPGAAVAHVVDCPSRITEIRGQDAVV